MSHITDQNASPVTVDRLPELLSAYPLPETDHFCQIRQRARELFPEIPLPHAKMEDWRHFNIGAILNDRYSPVFGSRGGQSDRPATENLLSAEDTAAELVFLNGAYRQDWSREQTGSEIWAGSLARAAADPATSGSVRELLGSVLDLRDPFVCLNTMFLADGAFIRVGRAAVCEKPVHLVFLHAHPEGTVTFPRLLVHVGEQASLRLVITHVFADTGESAWDNMAGELILEQGARLELEETAGLLGAPRRFLSLMGARLNRDSSLNWRVFTLDGELVRRDCRALLDAPGAEARVEGLFINSGKNMMDHPVRIHHRAPHGISRITFKGVALDESRSVYTGKVLVERDAQKTDSIQVNHNLVLSPEARVETRPQLEIYADDVRCTHGATAGPPPPEIVYYFQTRGIGRQQARLMLTRGFVEEIADEITVPALRMAVLRALSKRFGEEEP